MIKANELRIGNLVKQGIVESIGSSLIQVSNTIYESERIKPIELTEDFVIDLGLKPIELENGEWFYQDGKFRLNKNYAGFYYSKNLDVKYVHQLQNLYFALTGCELQCVA